jgi:hypothetical protein
MFSQAVFSKVVETDTNISIDFTSSVDARMLYNSLSIPIDFGTLMTGKKHQYKAYLEPLGNFLIYGTELSKNNFQCIFTINKTVAGNTIILENNEKQIHMQMTDYTQGKKIFDSLNIPVMQYGTWWVKVLADENNLFGISCMTDSSTFAEYQCDIRIFKNVEDI